MTEQVLVGHMGTSVTIDLCLSCQAFWFDGRESLRLAPASVLKLFGIIGDQAAASRPPLSDTSGCPRCGMRLAPTHDVQRTTRFQYLRCPAQHGRFITFFNFLREKDFLRPLSAQQIAELRQNVQSVNCSNCGAPIDLSKGTACSHCGSPLSMLDMKQAEALVTTLREADRAKAAVDPSLPLQLDRARRDVEAAFASFERDAHWFDDVSSAGLVGAGISSIAKWLRKNM
jgi:hypothetical protein